VNTKAAPGTAGGCVITGPSSNNRDYPPSADWSTRSFVFVTPDSTQDVFLRCGQWEVKGTVFFDDLSLRPVVPLYAKVGRFTLGGGERIENGRYVADPDFGGAGSNEFRGLIRHTAAFNSHRWVFGPGSTVVYRHQLADLRQTSGRLTVDIGYYQSGVLHVEASRDGETWTEVGRLTKQEGREMEVPATLYPAGEVWVRLRGSGGGTHDGGNTAPGQLQVYKYRYEAALAENVADAVGRTSYLEVLHQDPNLRVIVETVDGPDTGRSLVAGWVESPTPRDQVTLSLTLEREGRIEADLSQNLRIERGKPARFEVPFDPAGTGSYRLALAVGGDQGVLCFAAQTTLVVPALHASDYGYLISSGPQGAVWWCEGTYKISRRRPVPKKTSDRISLVAARNEYEPVQLVLRPAEDLKDVRVTATDMTGPAGTLSASNLTIDRVAWVRVTSPTDAVGCIGDWPDPLPRCDGPFDVPAGTNQPLWITVYVPSDTAPGDYQGSVKVSVAGQERWTVPLSLRVLGFALPKEAHVFATFGFDLGPVRKYHNLTSDDEVRQVYDLYMTNFAAHRIAPYNPMLLDPMRVTFTHNAAWLGGTRVGNEKASGTQSLKIVDDNDKVSVDAHTADLIPIDPQAGYVLRWKVKTAKPDQTYLVTLQNYDGNRQWMSGRNIDLPATGTGSWETQERNVTGRFPSEARFVNIVLRPVMWSEQGEQVGSAWFDEISFKRLPDGPELVRDGGFEAPPGDTEVSIDFRAFDKAARRYLDEFGFTRFSLPVMGMGSGTFHSRHKGEIAGHQQGTAEYDATMRKYLGQVAGHLAENGWLKKAYVYWFDEPEPKDYDFVKEGMAVLKRSAPGLTRMLTEQPEPELFGSVDLWCPLTASYDAKVCRERQAAGEHVMWYVCCGPREPYVTLFIDHPAIDLRMWLWQTFKYDVEGILVWHTNYWTSPCAYPEPNDQNPWEDPMSYVSGYDTPVGTKIFWGNGDGRFIYPPNRKGTRDKQTKYLTGPVNSIRWEMLREGIEDFEYLWQLRYAVQVLRRRGVSGPEVDQAEQLTHVPPDICTDLTRFTHDPRPLHEHRVKVGLALESLMKKHGLGVVP